MSVSAIDLVARILPGELQSDPADRALPLASQLPVGRLVEFSGERGGCHMTQAVGCLKHAQLRGETCAWVQVEGGSLFPPDLADSGIDLSALVIVHVPRKFHHAGLSKAAELMLRSGGFGMVIIDLWGVNLDKHDAWQGRLLGMAREHQCWVVILSPAQIGQGPHGGSLGPLISLRISGERRRMDRGHFAITPIVHKDKSSSLSGLAQEHRRGPWGLL